MQWVDIRRKLPHQWLVVEALQARSHAGRRQLEDISVVGTFEDSETAMRAYMKLHRGSPNRELYVVHTDRPELDIEERSWLGLRAAG
jgi:hypothetical protein